MVRLEPRWCFDTGCFDEILSHSLTRREVVSL